VYVMGISGIHGGVDEHRRRYTDDDERLSGFVQGLDSAAVLVRDGIVVAAAAEERFTGRKGTGDFPTHAIEYCLNSAGIEAADLEAAAHAFHYVLHPGTEALDSAWTRAYRSLFRPERQIDLWKRFLGVLPRQGVLPVAHHLAHARSSFDLSGFDRAAVIVSDGMGEAESMTLFHAKGDELLPVQRVSSSHSLGLLYSLVTYHLGFRPGMDEYKVMGLASFGDPDRYSSAFEDLVRSRPEGRYVIPFLNEETDTRGRELHVAARRSLTRLFGPPRQPGDEVVDEHRDLAAALQRRTEDIVLHVTRWARDTTGETTLCLAGGVALNCTANGKILDSGLFEQLFVQPAAGDDGSALGAALAVSRNLGRPAPVERMTVPYWGECHDDQALRTAALQRPEFTVEVFDDDRSLAARVADAITAGSIVAWYQGGMEFGPRALGNRSILADPRHADTRDRLNARIKKREDFRPFAPAVKSEAAHRLFHISPGSELAYAHMVVLTRTRAEHAASLAAVTHVNGTARVQTVERQNNPRFWSLLDALEERTGYPVVLNTSFNVQGQPIVRTPREAFDTAVDADLDGLVVGRCYLRRRTGDAA